MEDSHILAVVEGEAGRPLVGVAIDIPKLLMMLQRPLTDPRRRERELHQPPLL